MYRDAEGELYEHLPDRELVREGAPYCIFYCHWQGMNPSLALGWEAFTTMVRCVQRHLRDQVVWVRPSQYADTL